MIDWESWIEEVRQLVYEMYGAELEDYGLEDGDFRNAWEDGDSALEAAFSVND